jgi:arylsulfatase A-like enzyme
MLRSSPIVSLATFTTGLASAAALAASAVAAASARPNIIVILADDLGYAELGCYGQTKIKTPNLDRMAAEGQRWTQFYSGAPVCSPSRNVLLTGRHTGGCNVQNLKRVNPKESDNQLGGDWPMDEKAWTLPMALRKAGYHTAAFGKWGMGEYGTTGSPDRKGVDHFYGYTDHRMCHTFYPPFLWRNGRKETINDPGIPGHAKLAKGPVDDGTFTGQKHASERIIEELLDHLEVSAAAARDGGRPFFIYYCPLEPHVAMHPPKRWVNQYPKDWDEKPYLGDKGYTPHSRPRAGYAAMISYLDEHVGRVMAKLKQLGVDDNTLVVFSSDNGTTHDVGGVDHGFFNSVDDLRGLKGSLYEGGIRVPALIRWPGKVPSDKTIDQPGYSADLMPTICALTGADPGDPYGENLLAVVTGEKERLDFRRPLVWTGGGYGGQVAVRLGDMKAIRRNLYAKPGNWEVYDLAKDRAETTDLAATRRDVIDQANGVLRREYQLAPGYPELAIFAPETDGDANPRGASVFASLDSSADGFLTFEEWQQSPKAKAAPEKQEENFNQLDRDGDKRISRQEFLAQWKR